MAGPILEIKQNGSTRQFPIGVEPITIGRQIANMVVIDDTEASRFHCVVEKVANGYRVRDLGSRNGTKVNGHLIKVALLDQGDVVTIGKTELRLIASAPEPASVGKSPATQKSQAAGRTGGISLKPPPGEEDDVADEGGLNFLANEEYDPLADPVVEDAPSTAPVIDQNGPPTDSLLRMADALPEKAFNHFDIALINARGQVAHAAGAPKKKGDDNIGEAVTLLRLLLLVCFRTRASDIHIEPKNDIYLVRVRIDGIMVDAAKLKKEMGIRVSAVV